MSVRQISGRTQQQRTDAAKARIREAALELFALNGYEATTLADVSLRAGYSRALAQYHYGDKAALGLELLETRMRRDLNADLLICAPGAAGGVAWELLERHLAASWDQYRALHGKGQKTLQVRGEVALQHAASISTDRRMSDRLNALTTQLISRVAHILEICRQDGFIRPETPIQAVAVFYVHAIWGLASALFANPKGEEQIAGALEFLRATLNGLRASPAQTAAGRAR